MNFLSLFVGKRGEEPVQNGLFMQELVDFVKEHQGETGVKQLETAYGAPLKFSSLKTYPLVDGLRLRKLAALQVLGRDDEEAETEMGKWSFQTILNSQIGRKAIETVGKDPVKLVSSATYYYSLFTNYGERTVNFMGPAHARFNVKHDMDGPAYVRGIILAGLAYCGVKNPTVTYQKTGDHDFIVDIQWEPTVKS